MLRRQLEYTKRSYRSTLSTVPLHRGNTKVSIFSDLSESLQNRSVGKTLATQMT